MQYEARPTQYKGITFKSKSEAIIARGFDIAGALWMYEPDIIDTNGSDVFKDGYKPDFFVVHGTGHDLMQYYVEYKPKKPNNTYITELYSRFKKIETFHTISFCVLLCGSPFDINKDVFDVFKVYSIYKGVKDYSLSEFGEDTEFMYSHLEEAKKYRFDLTE